MVSVYYILRSDALLFSLDGDRHAVLVAAADEKHLLALEAKIAGINVCRHIYSREMPYVDGSVGIGERGCDKRSFKIFHYFLISFLLSEGRVFP